MSIEIFFTAFQNSSRNNSDWYLFALKIRKNFLKSKFPHKKCFVKDFQTRSIKMAKTSSFDFWFQDVKKSKIRQNANSEHPEIQNYQNVVLMQNLMGIRIPSRHHQILLLKN